MSAKRIQTLLDSLICAERELDQARRIVEVKSIIVREIRKKIESEYVRS